MSSRRKQSRRLNFVVFDLLLDAVNDGEAEVVFVHNLLFGVIGRILKRRC